MIRSRDQHRVYDRGVKRFLEVCKTLWFRRAGVLDFFGSRFPLLLPDIAHAGDFDVALFRKLQHLA